MEQWDILFSMIGTIGITYIEKNRNIDYACKNMGIFKFNGDENKAYWFYYYLQTPQAREYVLGHLRGTTQQYLPLESLRDFPIQVPERETCNKITSILRRLDDKIAINNAINENLARDSASPKGREFFSERAKPAPPRAHSAGEAAGFSRRTNAMIHERVGGSTPLFWVV